MAVFAYLFSTISLGIGAVGPKKQKTYSTENKTLFNVKPRYLPNFIFLLGFWSKYFLDFFVATCRCTKVLELLKPRFDLRKKFRRLFKATCRYKTVLDLFIPGFDTFLELFVPNFDLWGFFHITHYHFKSQRVNQFLFDQKK